MTTTMLNEFVEKILVHERDQKGRQDTGQEVAVLLVDLGFLDGADERRPVGLGVVSYGLRPGQTVCREIHCHD